MFAVKILGGPTRTRLGCALENLDEHLARVTI